METVEKPGLMEDLSFVTDPRVVAKTRHKLIDIVVITLCAVLAGADEWTEIAEFGRIQCTSRSLKEVIL
ncbi:transposase family protein [Desulfoglaeba alkanexedens]|uniref:Transposase family protein n=1 Tax=Desulfoglaeba alkanexedens ALDC TaxID=980445 RepID=A0A4P8L4I2_9BACT|nr:transposase family protein [Desulfoglaeba alkanexedens]QCQ22848.1 transposase family protein [Desulfoglaeba alkanexedens ALDC]